MSDWIVKKFELMRIIYLWIARCMNDFGLQIGLRRAALSFWILAVSCLFASHSLAQSGSNSSSTATSGAFTVATYNVENYLIRPTERRPDKPKAAQEKIQEALLAARPDVVALQEMGSRDALESLRQQLDSKGLKYSYWDHITGYDPDIHLSVLSRYPIVSKIPHSDISYRLDGKPLNVSRGFLEVEARITPEYRITIFVAHLKSKRPVSVADEAEMRLMEALELRKLIDAKLAADPDRNIVVLGDMNDTKDSPSVRALISSGKFKLTDTRPAERNGDNLPNPNPRYEPRNVTWTHYYGKEDTYSRIDYILISPGLRQEWDPTRTWIPEIPNWGQGSDHRLIMATFFAEDK